AAPIPRNPRSPTMASSSVKSALSFALLALSISSTALAAEPTAADKETARKFMAEAREKRAANDHKGALQAFQAADAIMHVPTTGLEVARTHAALGQLVEARENALRVARSTPEPDEPAPFKRAREEATQLVDDLGKRIPTITVK